MKYIISFAAVLFILTSCQEEVELKVKPNSSLFITSFISPQDSLIKVRITRTLPVHSQLLGVFEEVVEDALVTISDNTYTSTLSFRKEQGELGEERGFYYTTSEELKIQSGGTYYLKVISKEGDMLEGKCTVPLLNNSVSVTVDSFKVVSHNTTNEIFDVTVTWKDLFEGKNFYATAVNLEYSVNPHDTLSLMEPVHDDISEYIADKEESVGNFVEKAKFVFDDKLDFRVTKIICHFLSTDEDYYKYHKSIENYTSGNPFSEPSLLYSNISGGRGVFCSYNRFVLTKEL